MGRWHLSSDIELEFLMEGDRLVSKFDQQIISLLLNLLGQDGVEVWIESLSCVLKYDWSSISDTVLEKTIHLLGVHGGFDLLIPLTHSF